MSNIEIYRFRPRLLWIQQAPAASDLSECIAVAALYIKFTFLSSLLPAQPEQSEPIFLASPAPALQWH
jgi:hypothetical protein